MLGITQWVKHFNEKCITKILYNVYIKMKPTFKIDYSKLGWSKSLLSSHFELFHIGQAYF